MGGTPGRRSLCLFWRETKQRPELGSLTRPEVGEKRPVGKGTQRGSVSKGTQTGSVGEERRREAVENGQQKGPVKMS